MNLLLILFSFLGQLNSAQWITDFDQAKKIAHEQKKTILLNFSGSDWCGPCIRLKKEIFQSTTFLNFADSNFILVNADFPRNKKNRLSDAQTKQNNSLADKYNKEGIFPLTILMNEDGKPIHRWDGFPDGGADLFISQLRQFNHARN